MHEQFDREMDKGDSSFRARVMPSNRMAMRKRETMNRRRYLPFGAVVKAKLSLRNGVTGSPLVPNTLQIG